MAGVFNTLRERFAWILLVFIAGGILLFVFSDVITRLATFTQGNPNTVGEVLGEEIEYRELQTAFQNQLEQAQRQGQTVNDDLRRQLLDQAWTQLTNQRIFEKEFEGLGIDISDNHLRSIVFTDNPSAGALQVFGNPQTGAYDPSTVQSYYAQAGQNAELAQQLTQVEEFIIDNRRSEIYQKGISAALLVSKARAEQQLHLQQDKRALQFLAVTYAGIPDSSVTVTDRDFEAYYRENRNQFRREDVEAELTYVLFPKTPTAADTAAARESLASIVEEFQATEDDSLYAAAKTDVTEPARFVPVASLAGQDSTLVAENEPGTVVGPYLEGRFFKLTKISTFEDDSLAYVKGKHILVRANGATAADTADARTLADSLAAVATDENFQVLTIQFSEDPNTRFAAGELGWVQRGRFGAQFDSAAARAPIGRFAVVESQVGFHVIKLAQKTTRVVRLAHIRSEVYARKETLDGLMRKAAELDAKYTELKDFGAAAREMGYDVRTSPAITPDNRRIPGVEGASELTSFALSGEEGDRTGIKNLDNGILVGYISRKVEPGVQSLAAVREDIAPAVINRKKAEVILAKLGTVEDLNAGKTAYGDGAFVSKATDVTYSQGFIAGIGNDPKVAGVLFGLQPGELSKPIEGANGVYVLSLTGATPAELAPESIEQNRTQAQQALTGQLLSRLTEGLRLAAGVKDYRYKFPF